MAKTTIQLNGKAYPLAKTSRGVKLVKQLGVNLKAVENGKNDELMRYAYCMAAGAAASEKKAFDFTIEQFTKACPQDWKEQTVELFNAPDKPEATATK